MHVELIFLSDKIRVKAQGIYLYSRTLNYSLRPELG